MSSIWQDAKYGLRMMRLGPGFTAIAVIAIALGTGANTAIFSVVNAVLLQPLPYSQPEQVMILWEKEPQIPAMSIAYPNYVDWRAQNKSFSRLAAYRRTSVALTGTDLPEQISAAYVASDFFAAVDPEMSPQLGRLILSDEDRPGGQDVAVLSDGLWERRFGKDPDIIGTGIILDGMTHTVVGVMPREFFLPTGTEAWIPLGPQTTTPGWENRGNHPGLFVIARLRAGVSPQQAQAEMDTIAAGLAEQYPETNATTGAVVTPMAQLVTQGIRPSLLVLFGAALFVLLITCTNVANLLLGKAATRRKEVALRIALGAGRMSIMRQLLVESLLLSLLGGILGVLLATWGTDVLVAYAAGYLPSFTDVRTDYWVLGFAFLISALTGLVFGVVPALQTAWTDPNEAMKESGRSIAGGKQRLRSALAISQVALALVLLVGAGLLIKSFLNLSSVNPGFDSASTLVAGISLPAAKYPAQTEKAVFYDNLLQRLRALPGVEDAAITSYLPLGPGSQTSVWVSGRPYPAGDLPMADYAEISEDYFQAMGISLLSGRDFTTFDRLETSRAVIIDARLAEQFWPGEDPVGKLLVRGHEDVPENQMTVVGVAGSVHLSGLDTIPSRPQIYFPYRQAAPQRAAVVLRTAGDPLQLASPLRTEVQGIDPAQPVVVVQTMEQIVSTSLVGWRLNFLLMAIFAGLALALALLGIYGVMSYSVTRRSQEIGVRMALGAQRLNILRWILGRGLAHTAIGLTVGTAGALLLTRFLRSLLFQVQPTDPIVLAGVAAMLLLASLAACWLPARRASRLDPMKVLRNE